MSVRSLLMVLGATAVWLFLAAIISVSLADSPGQLAKTASPTDSNDDANRCIECHSAEVTGFLGSKMAHSMRTGAHEPAGLVQIPGTTIRMYTDKNGSWQTLEHGGYKMTYHVDYVIGSGTHATGYLIKLGDHLFQSPVSYYSRLAAYALAPGYEQQAYPNFSRPVGESCVFCHAGSFNAVAGTQNEYRGTPFPHPAISCNRCHGDVTAHLENPNAANIVNPENLNTAARDSVCEQCHLIGVARVLNPGKRFSDFQVGQPLEETFTIYRSEAPKGTMVPFRVISQSEQLALSKCKIKSGEKMWCGTCHDPHYEPIDPVTYFREKCMQCHAKTAFSPDHPPKTSNCIGCHMPTRDAKDGRHTAFTDHRIQLISENGPAEEAAFPGKEASSIVPWRASPPKLAKRNLGIALVNIGMETNSLKQVASGYQMLAEVQQKFSQDCEMYYAMGTALYLEKRYGGAVHAFEQAVRFDPISSPKEASLGQAYAAMGDQKQAEQHLEKAMELDSMNLTAAALLISVYQRTGESKKASELSRKIARLAHITFMGK
ncbi:MAG: hypothetical protein WA708_04445 [Acidobacteriaceae bacterium]